MATCGEIIAKALRKLNATQSGANPSTEEAADGLASLRSYYLEMVTGGGFGPLRDVSTAVDTVAYPNTRVMKTAACVVSLPVVIPDAACDGCIWDYGFVRCNPALLDMALITINSTVDATVESWLYDATAARWISLDNLDLNDPAPLSSRGDDGLAALLATRIADEYGGQLSPITVAAANRFKVSIATRPGSVLRVQYSPEAYF